MKKLSPVFLLPLLLTQLHAAPPPCDPKETAQETCIMIGVVPALVPLRRCSTEIINTTNCFVVIDRRYPVTLPAIQMHPGNSISVVLNNPLLFETASLDWASSTAQPGTEQLATLLTSAIPDLKGFTSAPGILPSQALFTARVGGTAQKESEKPQFDTIEKELAEMEDMVTAAQAQLPSDQDPQGLYDRILAVYAQLNQAIAPVPKPGSVIRTDFKPPPRALQTPDPWTNYADWRRVVLCELAGGSVGGKDCATNVKGEINPEFLNVLGDVLALQVQITPTTTPPIVFPIFDKDKFEKAAKKVSGEIDKLQDPDYRQKTTDQLESAQAGENSLLARISALTATLTSVQKDFATYYQNIYLSPGPLPDLETINTGDKNQPTLDYVVLDPAISDPRDRVPHLYPSFLGRPVTYTVNIVDNIANAQASVYANSNKVAIATVPALFADPRLEGSAGAMLSFVHSRTFANQTIANAAGTPYTAGEIVIQQTKTDRELVPFVALNCRIGDEFRSLGGRRGALYGTGFVGLNPVTTLPEFGGGPTVSWRSIMLSFLYNRAHETQLIAGETVGEVVCNPAASAGSTPPPCTPAPPAPVTQVKSVNAFAIGLSVRIPTSFAALTGGVSR